MSFWIKICGNTTLDDALLATDAGADAVGFVFASSPRHVTVEQVASITVHLPDSIEKIGVFVDSSFEEITKTVRESGLTGVQLHFDAGIDSPKKLRDKFGPRLRILRVLHYGEHLGDLAARVFEDINIDALLVDSRTAEARGGTGLRFDWKSAATTLSNAVQHHHRFVVAGGLTPANVAEAVSMLHPWGVDVVSGVEGSPGRKDAEKVKSFVARARAAATLLELDR